MSDVSKESPVGKKAAQGGWWWGWHIPSMVVESSGAPRAAPGTGPGLYRAPEFKPKL